MWYDIICTIISYTRNPPHGCTNRVVKGWRCAWWSFEESKFILESIRLHVHSRRDGNKILESIRLHVHSGRDANKVYSDFSSWPQRSGDIVYSNFRSRRVPQQPDFQNDKQMWAIATVDDENESCWAKKEVIAPIYEFCCGRATFFQMPPDEFFFLNPAGRFIFDHKDTFQDFFVRGGSEGKVMACQWF